VLVVTKSGGQYNSVTAALNSINDNSATNRYLVYVAPGVYTETVTMKQYVDIEGAGELTTKITQIGSGSSITGTVIGASNAELRFLTVENTGGNTNAIAIYNSSASPRLTHVSVTASGGTGSNYGVSNSSSSPTMTDVSVTASGGGGDTGVWNSSSSLTMTNVTILALNGSNGNIGVRNDSSSSLTMTNVTVTALGGAGTTGVANNSSSATIHNSLISASGGTTSNFGVSNTASTGVYTVTVDNSQIVGSGRTIYNDSHFTTRVGASKLDGGTVFVNGGTITCAGVYDENYTFYASTCP
jgi:pectin methylesterase-like acyl-CoA thioesterase